MEKAIKTLTLTKTKVAQVDGEHTITFVASTSSEDRDYEHVAINTFRLPLKGGGHIVVADLPAEGADNVDIPLLTDHDLYSVDKTIGSVRRAFFVDGALIFEAGISSRPYAQEMFTLVKEGHLDNAFSIQWRDYQFDDANSTFYNGEIVEVSLVTRGSNMDAQVLATKSMKGVEVEQETTTEAIEVTTSEDVETTTEAVENSAEEVVETTAEAETAEEVTEAEEETKEEKEEEMTTQNEVAKTLVKEEATQVKFSNNGNYLESKSAMHDFARTIIDNQGNSSKVMRAWKNNLEAKGLAGDAILPSQIEQVFFKAWTDNEGVLGTFRNTNARSFAVNAFYGANAEDIRAKGHKKGELKANQIITNARRDLKNKIVYKKLPLDLQDILDDTTGEILRFRVEELAARVANEITVGALLGDGRTAPGEGEADYRVFDGTRGLFSMKADILGTSTDTTFAGMVARKINNVNTDTIYAKIIKTLSAVKPTIPGGRKVIIVPENTIATLLLIQAENGGYLFAPGTDFSQVFGARIFELPEMANSGLDVIAYAENGYTLCGSDQMVRTDLDLNYNQDVMLVERAVSGSLTGFHTAAGYVSASVSA